MFKSLFSALLAISCLCALVAIGIPAAAQPQPTPEPPKVTVDADGTVHVPAQVIPQSSFLTPEAKAYVAQHLIDMQNPEAVKQDAGVPRFMKPMLDWDRQNFALDRQDTKIAGVHVYVYTPMAGIAAANRKRVLMNLHGGGFSGCWPACAELESMPLSALMGIKVVSVDYREGPENKFPAASEDVAAVYQELLKTYKPGAIGIYGCSAGGMLTAMSVAWFQSHGIPAPGAIGIYCASAGGFGGDATSFAFPAGEARLAGNFGSGQMRLGYLSTADPKDPLVSPIESSAVLAKFPPTLLITGTRDFAFSGALNTDAQLNKLGVDSELHVWDGLFHGFFYKADVPESKDAFHAMIRFFDRHLAKE